jgi:glycogen synthase
MKVVFYTNEFPPNVYGGAGVAVEYLTRELARLMDVEVRCFGSQRLRRGRLKATGFAPWADLSAGSEPGIAKALEAVSINLQFCKSNDADVVHCHTWYSNLGGLLTKVLHKIPLVITTHSLEPLRPWKREQLGPGYDLSRWIEGSALACADAVIAVSGGMKKDIQRCYGIDPRRIHVIHNGIDIRQYRKVSSASARRAFGIDLETPYILFVGRVTRQKGIIHLVNAIRHVRPEAQVVLCAGAPDTMEIGKEMEARVREVQRERGNVVWIRQMASRRDTVELYSNAAVFCCPSIYEPFGIINVEAMACETPVVASAVGGILEVVEPGKTGLLIPFDSKTDGTFEPKDPEKFSRSLAHGINKLLQDPGLARRLGRAGRARVEKEFNWATIARRTQALYQGLVRSPRRNP